MGASLFAAGTLVGGRYEVEGEIGRGGAAVVYAARDRQVGTAVALKVIFPPPAAAERVRSRTRREIRAVRALAHPSVVPIFDLFEEGPFIVLVMERVLGRDLEALVAERGPLPAEQVAAIGQGVAEALAVAHRRGIVHRDIKPRNILIDETGRPRLTDFGAARMDGQETLTETGGLIGTLDYAAPEVLGGGRGDARVDIHALGLTLHFALTGRLPARLAAHLPPTPAEEGHHPRALRPDLPPWLDAVVARATAALPRGRFPTAAGLAEALSASHTLAPLPSPSVPGRLDFCLACGAPDPFARTWCRRCAEVAPAAADTWLLVAAPPAPADRRALAARLAGLLHLPGGDAGAAEAAAGRRALLRLPRALAEPAAAQLAARGVPARLIPARSDWRLLPGPAVFLTGAVAAVGTMVGMVANPGLLLTTPAMTGLLLVLAYRAVARPLLATPPRDERLPAAVVREVAETLAGMPDGDGRPLLADIVRLGRELHAREEGPGALGQPIESLIRAACHAGRDLGQTEKALSLLAEARPGPAAAIESWAGETARLETARTALLQHLLDTLACLGTALAQAVGPASEAREALARQVQELEDELAARAQARAEVDALF